MRALILAAAVAGAALASPTAAQDSKSMDGKAMDGRGGRYTMTPVDGGFLRLDTETGAVSLCAKPKDGGSDWSCAVTPDTAEAMRTDIERLKAENEMLKADIRRMEETFGLGPPKVGEQPGEGKKAEGPRPPGKFEMPSEKDVDQAIDYLSRMIKKFRDKIKELDPERPGGTPL